MGRRALLAATWLAALPASPGAARAQAAPGFPSRPIRMLVPFPPGGASDILTRLAAQEAERALGQPVVLDNRPGAAGNLAVDAVAKAAPDGHTIGAASVSNLAINPHLYRSMPYDVARDLAPLSLFAINPNVIVAHPGVPARTLDELVAWVRANPGQAFATGGIGTSQHLAAELLKQAAGIDMQHVPYRGSAPAIADVATGRVPIMVDVSVTALANAREGKVRAIAVTTPRRLPQAPDVPAVAETYPGFEATSWLGFVAPARTPEAVQERLARTLGAAARAPEVARRLEGGALVPRGSTRAEFAAFIRAETERWGPAVRASGAQLE